jgi:hypothetical protein
MGRDELVNLLKSKMSEISKLNVEKNKIKKFLDLTFSNDVSSLPNSIFEVTPEQYDLVFNTKITDPNLLIDIKRKKIQWLKSITFTKMIDVGNKPYDEYNQVYDEMMRNMEKSRNNNSRPDKKYENFWYLSKEIINLKLSYTYVNNKFQLKESFFYNNGKTIMDLDESIIEIEDLINLIPGLQVIIQIELSDRDKYVRDDVSISLKSKDGNIVIGPEGLWPEDFYTIKDMPVMLLYKEYVRHINDYVFDHNQLEIGETYFFPRLLMGRDRDIRKNFGVFKGKNEEDNSISFKSGNSTVIFDLDEQNTKWYKHFLKVS